MALGRVREAESELTASLDADPVQPEARLAQAFAFEALGRPADAITAFRAFLVSAPQHPAAPRARAEIARLAR